MLDPPLDPSRGVNSGGEPAYCPSCELRHTRRSDWLCPRCRMPVEANVPPPRARRAVPYEKKFPRGSRIAGALLVVSGGALAIGFARHPALDHRWRLLAAAIVLAVLGVAMLLKVSAARWLAVAVAVVAALLVAEAVLRDRLPGLLGDPLPASIRQPLRDLFGGLSPARISFVLGSAAASVLLIVGRPRRVRIAVGLLLAAPLVVVELLRAFGR